MLNNMKNYDLNDLYLLSKPAKLLLACLMLMGIFAFGYLLFFQDQLNTLKQKENEETELKQTYVEKSGQVANLVSLQAELSAIRSAFNSLLSQLPTDAEIPTLIQELHQAGSNNGLRLDSVLPQPPSNDGSIQKLPYEIAITGKYDQISQFVRDVGQLSRIITLESLSITSSSANDSSGNRNAKSSKGNELLTLKATATTYKARPAEELAAEAEQQKAENQTSEAKK